MDNETDSSNTFQIPEDLTALTADELETTRQAAREEFARLRELGDALTDEQIASMEALADLADNIAAEDTRRETEAADRAARVEAAAARMEADGGDDDGEDTGDGDDGADDGEGDEGEGDAGDAAPEAVAAGGSAIRRIKQRQPRRPVQRIQDGMTIVAAADVGSGIVAGAQLEDTRALADAFLSRSRAFDGVRSTNARHQFNVASIQRNFDRTSSGLHVGNKDFADVQTLLQEASRESRLSGNSLAAAGGWCAPSENMYGLCQKETLDGIIDLPEVGVNRGGINYTPGPDFSAIYAAAGFVQTEAQAEAGDTKPCTEIDCPPFQEVRLDAVGICVSAPILTRAAYPELVQRWIEGTIVANQHKVAARLITAMQTALGTALAPTLTGTPITWSLLTMLEWHAEMERQAYRLGESETLEVKAPRWLRVVVRADLANRAGVAAESVSNAQIAQHFADRGVAIQWILNYQEIGTPLTSVAFPSTVEVMMYPAGTFVKGTADVINLDTVYDSTGLAVNTYTAAFAEDGVLIAKMCHGGKRITLPVHVTGQMGALDLNQTWGTAQVLVDPGA